MQPEFVCIYCHQPLHRGAACQLDTGWGADCIVGPFHQRCGWDYWFPIAPHKLIDLAPYTPEENQRQRAYEEWLDRH